MSRTPRCRRIRRYPEYWSFAPQGDEPVETIVMSLDEYECIRLIDREKLTQEQCARRMGVARTTVTNIYESARSKLAEAGIRLYAGVQGSADEAAKALAEGRLEYDSDARCDHHEHHGGDCGHDHCAEHHCRGN